MEYAELTKAFKQIIRILLEFHGAYSTKEVRGLLSQHFKESPYQKKYDDLLRAWDTQYKNGNNQNPIIKDLILIENREIQEYFKRTPSYLITERLDSRFYKETYS